MVRPTRSPSLRRHTSAVLALVALVSSLLMGPAPSLAAPSRAELEAAQDRLMELEREFELVVEEYNLVHERLEGLRRSIATAELDVANIEDRMRTKQDAAVALATELYKGGGAAGVVEAVLSSSSLTEMDENLTYLRASESEQSRVFESLAVDRAALNREIATLEDARAEAAREESRLATLQADIEAKVDDQRDEISRLNELIQRAERREARRLERLERARAAAAAAAADTAAAAGSVGPAPAPNARAQTAVDAALSQLGKPYVWAAEGPDAYDCSGLTLWAWAHAGVTLPHNSGAQYAATPRVAQSDWKPGDLLFFGTPIHHVAMYIGNGEMVEAPYTGSQVRVVSAYRSDYVGAGRPGV